MAKRTLKILRLELPKNFKGILDHFSILSMEALTMENVKIE